MQFSFIVSLVILAAAAGGEKKEKRTMTRAFPASTYGSRTRLLTFCSKTAEEESETWKFSPPPEKPASPHAQRLRDLKPEEGETEAE